MSIQRLVSVILIGLLAFAATTRWQNLSEEPLIMTDGQGYYAYLPAVFLYHDLQFHFVDSINQHYYAADKRANYVVPGPNGNVNKYFVGTSVVQAPFFLITCAVSKVLGVPVDGYSWPFQLMVGLASIVSLALGLLLLGKLLVSLGFSTMVTSITLLFITFGTNMFYYAVYEPSMSHVYSFMTIAAFLYFVRISFVEQQRKAIMLAALALALTVLIRPVNGLVLFSIPVVGGGLLNTVNGIGSIMRHHWKWVSASVLLATMTMALQPLIYLIQTGQAFVWSYQQEGFDFSHPALVNVLFSFRKGLFVYCPILLLALGGIVMGVSKRKEGQVELLTFLALVTWVIASWWMWYYGGSYGHRAFIEFYPFFAIGMATAIQRGIWFIGPSLVRLLGVLFVLVQLVQTYQYNLHIIPFDNMTEQKYWNLFLRTGDDLAWYYSGYEGQDSYRSKDSILVTHDMESEKGWGNEQQFTEVRSHQGARSANMSESDQYGPTVRIIASQGGGNLVRVSGWVWSDSRSTDLAFVCAIEDSTGNSYVWNKRPLRPQFNGTENWTWVSALFRTGAPKDSSDTYVIYPMKSDGANIYLDDLEISFITAE
ncbi:MAG: hypothetical protein RL266_117 [Bacteroidota bacterium]